MSSHHQPDTRWHQRLDNFKKAFSQLKEAVVLYQQRPLSHLETQGLIKTFEFTHELSWNVIKDFFEYQGNTSIMGSRDATREAFQKGLISDGSTWMEMIKSRNQTSHTYNEDTAIAIVDAVVNRYFSLFEAFLQKMSDLKNASH